jgi:hypothetical protein
MDRDRITRIGARAPGVERQKSLAWWCLATQEADGAERRQNRCEWRARRTKANWSLVTGMSGAGLTGRDFGKALSERPALEPYWGKPAVRNLREDNGNVGIIRSPVRAIVLPDHRRLGPRADRVGRPKETILRGADATVEVGLARITRSAGKPRTRGRGGAE